MASKSTPLSKQKTQQASSRGQPSSKAQPSTSQQMSGGPNGAKSLPKIKQEETTKSHVSVAPGAMPTLDDVDKVAGKALTKEELKKLQSSGALPMSVNLAMNPAMHKIKSGEEEITVIMVDAPPCGCRKVNGKKERCRLHRAQKRNKKKTKKAKKAPKSEAKSLKDGQVRDDDSDRKKLGALRHAEDSDEEGEAKIEGAFTPDKVCIVGPAGVAILVPIDTAENPNAAARATDAQKDPIKGILIKGPQDCPQFIPENKIPKDENGEPAFDGKFQTGVLVRNAKGEHVFFPDGGAKYDDKGQPINVAAPGADGKVQDAVGDKLHIAGIVDVNENGMLEFRPVDEKNPAPQDKMATVGVLTKDTNGVMVFLQTKGQTVGSGDAAPPIVATQEGPQPAGKVMGHVVLKNGKLDVVPVGQANGAEVVGIIAMGNMNQPVMIVKKGGSLDKPGAVNYDDAAIKKYTDADWKPLVVNNETMQKEAAPAIQNNNIAIIASQTGKSPDELRKVMENREVASCSFVQGPYDPYRSVFAYQKTAGQTKAAASAASRAAEAAAAAGGAGGAGGSGAGAGGAGGNAGGSADVRSVAFGYGGGAYAPKSVFFSPSAAAAAKNEAAKANPKSVFATRTPSAGKDATSCYFASK